MTIKSLMVKIDEVMGILQPIEKDLEFLQYFIPRRSALFEAFMNEEIETENPSLDEISTASQRTRKRLENLLISDELNLKEVDIAKEYLLEKNETYQLQIM